MHVYLAYAIGDASSTTAAAASGAKADKADKNTKDSSSGSGNKQGVSKATIPEGLMHALVKHVHMSASKKPDVSRHDTYTFVYVYEFKSYIVDNCFYAQT